MRMRNKLLLHTTEAGHYVTNDKKKILYRQKIYYFTKGGISIPNQQIGSLTCKKKTRKQTIVTLAYVPDMSTVNSQAIHTMNKKDTSTKNFEFGQELMIDIAYQTSHE